MPLSAIDDSIRLSPVYFLFNHELLNKTMFYIFFSTKNLFLFMRRDAEEILNVWEKNEATRNFLWCKRLVKNKVSFDELFSLCSLQ
jgi:hypothetical protein